MEEPGKVPETKAEEVVYGSFKEKYLILFKEKIIKLRELKRPKYYEDAARLLYKTTDQNRLHTFSSFFSELSKSYAEMKKALKAKRGGGSSQEDNQLLLFK